MEGFLAFLPYALLFLLCPLMMLFMHRGGGHDGHADGHAQHHLDERARPARGAWVSRDEAADIGDAADHRSLHWTSSARPAPAPHSAETHAPSLA